MTDRCLKYDRLGDDCGNMTRLGSSLPSIGADKLMPKPTRPMLL